MFSILIPTFNNLEYLKICIESLKKNSKFDHQIIVHVIKVLMELSNILKIKILSLLIQKKILECLKL